MKMLPLGAERISLKRISNWIKGANCALSKHDLGERLALFAADLSLVRDLRYSSMKGECVKESCKRPLLTLSIVHNRVKQSINCTLSHVRLVESVQNVRIATELSTWGVHELLFEAQNLLT